MYLATLAWLSLFSGWCLRKKRSWHIPLVLTGMLLDLGLVLYLEITRQAVETALSFRLNLLKQLHVATSTSALVLYFPVFWFGYRLFYTPSDLRLRKKHKSLAQLALVLRTMGFFLMFSMWHSASK